MKYCNNGFVFLRLGIAVILSCMLLPSCYKDGTDYISDEVRISLYPTPAGFAADGTTLDGAEAYSAVVTVNYGSAVSGGKWTAEILDSPSWVSLKEVLLTYTYPDTWGTTGIHENQEKGIEISAEPNGGSSRSFTLRISAPSGEFRDYVVKQDGLH